MKIQTAQRIRNGRGFQIADFLFRSLKLKIFVLLFVVCHTLSVAAQAQTQSVKIAVFSVDEKTEDFAARLAAELQTNKSLKLLDRDLTTAAARGAAGTENNSFNLSLAAARNVGTAIDCDYFLVTKHETLRRSSFEKPVYFESYAIVFLVSARTGRLIDWHDRYFEADSTAEAVKLQSADLPVLSRRLSAKLLDAMSRERSERFSIGEKAKLIEELPDENQENFRAPLPFRRLTPEYTIAARRLDIEATVDIRAELDETGAVVNTEIVRWAGFGLDESVAASVNKMQFRPALRDGKPIRIKVLLRYNFREIR